MSESLHLNASTWRIALTWQSEKGRLAGSQADRENQKKKKIESVCLIVLIG